MKKLSIFAVALAAMAFTACGGNKSGQATEETDSLKAFEQEQIEEKIKMEFDSLASELGKLKKLPVVNAEGGITLTAEEKQVKPDYLLNPSAADNAETLAEKYRMLSALSVDKQVAAAYEMPVDDYKAAIMKLVGELNDPSFKALDDNATLLDEAQNLYNEMEQNGRINFFWQMAATSLVEQLFVISQNSDKFLEAFDDDAASNVTYRIVLLQDAINRLTAYDPEIEPVANAIKPLSVLNAISVADLKTQLAAAKEQIVAARAALVK